EPEFYDRQSWMLLPQTHSTSHRPIPAFHPLPLKQSFLSGTSSSGFSSGILPHRRSSQPECPVLRQVPLQSRHHSFPPIHRLWPPQSPALSTSVKGEAPQAAPVLFLLRLSPSFFFSDGTGGTDRPPPPGSAPPESELSVLR